MSDVIIQGSPEWFAIRCGKATASRVADICAKTKTGWGASRANYAAQLICERLTKTVAESYTNAAMQWGTDTEPQAREAYEFDSDALVDQIGFMDHPSVAMSGASPDGLVGEDGMLEIKCPNSATHIETLLGQSIPQKYAPQMQWQLACAGPQRLWCDFVSFDPRLPGEMRKFQRRMPRDNAMIAELEREVTIFLAEVEAKIQSLNSLYRSA